MSPPPQQLLSHQRCAPRATRWQIRKDTQWCREFPENFSEITDTSRSQPSDLGGSVSNLATYIWPYGSYSILHLHELAWLRSRPKSSSVLGTAKKRKSIFDVVKHEKPTCHVSNIKITYLICQIFVSMNLNDFV